MFWSECRARTTIWRHFVTGNRRGFGPSRKHRAVSPAKRIWRKLSHKLLYHEILEEVGAAGKKGGDSCGGRPTAVRRCPEAGTGTPTSCSARAREGRGSACEQPVVKDDFLGRVSPFARRTDRNGKMPGGMIEAALQQNKKIFSGFPGAPKTRIRHAVMRLSRQETLQKCGSNGASRRKSAGKPAEKGREEAKFAVFFAIWGLSRVAFLVKPFLIIPSIVADGRICFTHTMCMEEGSVPWRKQQQLLRRPRQRRR